MSKATSNHEKAESLKFNSDEEKHDYQEQKEYIQNTFSQLYGKSPEDILARFTITQNIFDELYNMFKDLMNKRFPKIFAYDPTNEPPDLEEWRCFPAEQSAISLTISFMAGWLDIDDASKQTIREFLINPYNQYSKNNLPHQEYSPTLDDEIDKHINAYKKLRNNQHSAYYFQNLYYDRSEESIQQIQTELSNEQQKLGHPSHIRIPYQELCLVNEIAQGNGISEYLNLFSNSKKFIPTKRDIISQFKTYRNESFETTYNDTYLKIAKSTRTREFVVRFLARYTFERSVRFNLVQKIAYSILEHTSNDNESKKSPKNEIRTNVKLFLPFIRQYWMRSPNTYPLIWMKEDKMIAEMCSILVKKESSPEASSSSEKLNTSEDSNTIDYYDYYCRKLSAFNNYIFPVYDFSTQIQNINYFAILYFHDLGLPNWDNSIFNQAEAFLKEKAGVLDYLNGAYLNPKIANLAQTKIANTDNAKHHNCKTSAQRKKQSSKTRLDLFSETLAELYHDNMLNDLDGMATLLIGKEDKDYVPYKFLH